MAQKFKCPVCGKDVEVVSENIITPLSTKRIKVLLCPSFESIGGRLVQHIVRIRYGGKWEEPHEFLISPKDGIYEVVAGSRDEVAHYILRHELWSTNGLQVDGAYLNKVTKVKILWKNGKAVGYYSWFTHTPVPTLGEIYVRPQYRGRGYSIELLRDFLDSNPGPVAFYWIHRKCMRNLLMKVGLIKMSDGRYVYIDDRIRLLSWQDNPIPWWEKERDPFIVSRSV